MATRKTPTPAQPGATPDRTVQRLRAQVTKLKAQLKAAEAPSQPMIDDDRADSMLLRAFMDRSDLLAWLKDERGRLVYANRNWFREYGLAEAAALGRNDFELFAEEVARAARARDLEVLGGDEPVRTLESVPGADGRHRHWQVTRFPFHDDASRRFVGGIAFDATERVQQDEEVRRLAITDPLTGLLNRRGFYLLAEPELARARRRGAICTMVFIDLDGLKGVNDRLGHQSGDAILVLAGLILKKVFRDTDIVARLGGDEFAVFAPDTTGDVEVIRRRLAQAIDDLASNPILKAQLGFSIGLLRCGPDEQGPFDKLVSRADELMYDEKRAKRAVRSRAERMPGHVL